MVKITDHINGYDEEWYLIDIDSQFREIDAQRWLVNRYGYQQKGSLTWAIRYYTPKVLFRNKEEAMEFQLIWG